MVMSTLTHLCARNEVCYWDNRPFIHSWPEPPRRKLNQGAEIKKTIKKKPKRTRTSFTTEQLKFLEATFANQSYVNANDRLQLAKAMKIGEKQIKVWFQNRRMKEKRRSTESCETYSEISASPSPSSHYRNDFESSIETNDLIGTYSGVPNAMYNPAEAYYGETNATEYQLPLHIYNMPETSNAALVDFFDTQYANYLNVSNTHSDMNVGNLHHATYNYNHTPNIEYNNSVQNNAYIYDYTGWQ